MDQQALKGGFADSKILQLRNIWDFLSSPGPKDEDLLRCGTHYISLTLEAVQLAKGGI
jgi:hypothetical protein